MAIAGRDAGRTRMGQDRNRILGGERIPQLPRSVQAPREDLAVGGKGKGMRVTR